LSHILNIRFVKLKFFHNRYCIKSKRKAKKQVCRKTLGAYFQREQLAEQIYKKYFRTHYAGKPTKLYLKLTQQIHRAESITESEIERALS